MKKLEIGDEAPAFSLRDQAGQTVSLADFRGRKLMVYFYPKASTPGCTVQACAVRDAEPALREARVSVVGISPDKPLAQSRFDAKHMLGFPLLADEDHQVAEAYGVWGEKSMYGKTYMGIIRSAFLVDGKGVIEAAWYGVSPQDTVPRLLAALDAGAR